MADSATQSTGGDVGGSSNGSASLPILSRAAILAKDDRGYGYVTLPGYDGRVRVRSMSAALWQMVEDHYISLAKDGPQTDAPVPIRARVVRECVVDENGIPIFQESDEPVLMQKSPQFVNAIYSEVVKLSAPTDKAVEDAKKNSEGGPAANT